MCPPLDITVSSYRMVIIVVVIVTLSCPSRGSFFFVWHVIFSGRMSVV